MSFVRSVSCSTAEAALIALLAAGCACERPELAITGESSKPKAGERLPKQSAIFDGRQISLSGVRGETLGISLYFDDGKEHDLRVVMPSHVADVDAFEVGYVNVREPSTSMYGDSRGPGRYPDLLRPVSEGVTARESAFFDLKIQPDAPAGRHTGAVEIDGVTHVLELSVYPRSIELAKDPLVWVFYHPKEVARVHGVPEDDGPELIELESRYHELFRQHGALLATDLGPGRFPPRRRFVKDVRYWPVAIDISSEQAIRRDVSAWLAFFSGSPVIPFVIPVDEPITPDEKRRAAEIARLIGEAGGGGNKLMRGITDRYHDVYDGVIDVWFSPWDIPERARARQPRGERFWTYNGRPPSAGSMIIDTHGVALRTWGWIAYLYGIELWYAWEGLYFSDRYNRGGPTDVEKDPITFDERSRGGSDFGNGDGLLAYPGPRPSLRLKALRRGLSDRLLLLALDRCGAADEARRIAKELVPRALGEAGNRPSWPRDERAWERARQRVLDELERRNCG